MLFRSGEEWCIWDVTNELLEYPSVYFASVEQGAEIEDDTIRSAGAIILYLPREGDAAAWAAGPGGGNAAWADASCELVFEEKYCDVYYVEK